MCLHCSNIIKQHFTSNITQNFRMMSSEFICIKILDFDFLIDLEKTKLLQLIQDFINNVILFRKTINLYLKLILHFLI